MTKEPRVEPKAPAKEQSGAGGKPSNADKDRVLIFDTTLRDGEQSPGASMTHEEKLQVAELLDEMGVDIIEAGFPIASNGDFEAVHEIAKRTQNAVIAGLARAIPADIDRAGEAVRVAKRPRIHTFVSTSPIHLEYQMKKSQEEVLDIITYACSKGMRVHFHPEHPMMLFENRDAEYLFLPIMDMIMEATKGMPGNIIWEHGPDARCIPFWEEWAQTNRFYVTLTAHHLATS